MRILVVEDEPRMLELLSRGLYESGFTVMTAANGAAGLAIAVEHEIDVIVLDIGLPQMDGYVVMRQLRALARPTPVLMLTARDREDDIIHGFECGADDYLTKPFSFAELVARLHAITRRPSPFSNGRIDLKQISIDPIQQTVLRSNDRIDLTRHELLLLMKLARHAGSCVARHTLMQSVWSHENVSSGTLDVLVNSVRTKIDGPYSSRLIHTVRGVGYILLDSVGEPRQ